MNFIYNDIINKNNGERWVITILIFIIAGESVGLTTAALLNISNYIVIFFLEIIFTVLFLLFYRFMFPIDNDNENSVKALVMKAELKRALEREEFVIHYQPQVDIDTNQIIRCEALIRWNHPKIGIIYPKDFIPLAEKTGLIIPIGKWILKEASKQLKIWHDMGFDNLKLSVNISACQFQESDLADTILNILQSTGLDPCFLEIEITENSIMRDTKLAVETIKKLKNMGIKIAIDDFGTGFSSINYVREFLADMIKIDKSFVWNITHDSNDAALTTAIIHMAKILNMDVIAEGVETKEQLEFLYSKGCTQIQGFLISPPVNAQAFERLLSERMGVSNKSNIYYHGVV